MSGTSIRKISVSDSTESALMSSSSLLARMFSMLARSFHMQRMDAETSLRIDEKLSLGPKKTLFLVGCSGRQFLVATGADTIVSMVEVSTPEHRGPRSFRKLNRRVWQRQERTQ